MSYSACRMGPSLSHSACQIGEAYPIRFQVHLDHSGGGALGLRNWEDALAAYAAECHTARHDGDGDGGDDIVGRDSVADGCDPATEGTCHAATAAGACGAAGRGRGTALSGFGAAGSPGSFWQLAPSERLQLVLQLIHDALHTGRIRWAWCWVHSVGFRV
jgi:hypothetical protein